MITAEIDRRQGERRRKGKAAEPVVAEIDCEEG
jgi:hypothetical protein